MSRLAWLTAPLRVVPKLVLRPGPRTDRRVERARDASTNPLDELGRALGPVLLPPLGVAVAGMSLLSVGWNIAAAGLLLVA